MNKFRFYIDTMGNDDKAYKEAISFAGKLADQHPEVTRVILLIGQKGQDGWFGRIFGDGAVKALYKGAQFKDCRPMAKFETVRNYKDGYSKENDIVITCGLDSDTLFKIDDYDCVHSIIAIPWLKERTEEWVKTWNPQNLRQENSDEKEEETVSCIAQKAFEDLTSSINMSTGIRHSADNDLAKTYILALHDKGELRDSTKVRSYLVKALGWGSGDAQDVCDLIDTLNKGKFFRGGSRIKASWKYHIDRWQAECSN